MKVERIAECSPWSILEYFSPVLSANLSYFLSGCLRQVSLFNQQSIYIYAYKSLCQCVGKVYFLNVNCGYFEIACAHHFIFCSMDHFGPHILKKNLKQDFSIDPHYAGFIYYASPQFFI